MKTREDHFEIVSEDLLARIGKLYTKSGVVRTPTLVPVINPVKNAVPPSSIVEMGYDLLITNAYIIKRRFGAEAEAVGVHSILGVETPVMTDSGAYQLLMYGEVDVEPEEILDYQVKIGSDIGVILDIPTKVGSSRDVVKREVEETLRRAQQALSFDRGEMLLVGPVQGGTYLDLVAYSAQRLSQMDFDIYAVGSPTQLLKEYRFGELIKLIATAKMNLPIGSPLHLFGAGHPLIIPFAVALGVDLFDSASYALYAMGDRYMTPYGTIRLERLKELPCSCPVCSNISTEDLKTMSKAEREKLVAKHNLYVLLQEVRATRQAIEEGTLWNYLEAKSRAHPSLHDAMRQLRRYVHFIEKHDPVTHVNVSAEFFYDEESRYRPSIYRYFLRLRDRYTPPPRKVLVLLPETPEKPFSRYGWIAELKKRLEELKINGYHLVVYSRIYGIIPLELDELYPCSQYEAATFEGREYWNDIAWFIRRYGSFYRDLIFFYEESARVPFQALAAAATEAGRKLEFVPIRKEKSRLLQVLEFLKAFL